MHHNNIALVYLYEPYQYQYRTSSTRTNRRIVVLVTGTVLYSYNEASTVQKYEYIDTMQTHTGTSTVYAYINTIDTTRTTRTTIRLILSRRT